MKEQPNRGPRGVDEGPAGRFSRTQMAIAGLGGAIVLIVLIAVIGLLSGMA